MYKEHMPPAVMRFLQRSRCRPKHDGVSCPPKPLD
ncbi:CG31337 [Drosophila busckii]|uniref:CG31337 n=1 Tax=Drosophila busckii TaxID=30019 RepID=A0A0M4EJX4_DROBS|nr:CG31337 [Drosophila busckii]